MQEALAHIKGYVLEIIGRYAYLTDNLLLRRGELGTGQPTVTQLLQFLVYQFCTCVGIVRIATEIDTKGTCVGV